MMRAPVCHLTARVIPKETKEVMNPILVVGPRGSRSKPHFVIKFPRGLAIRDSERVRFRSIVHRCKPYFDVFNFPESAGANVFAGFAELGTGALLAASLEDAFILPNGFYQCLAFGYKKSERFLAINVLAGLASMNRRQRVPVIGRADQHGVN